MELLKAIASRHSQRSYKADQISDQALETILSAGSAAPVSMRAYADMHITVVQNKEMLARISEATAKVFGQQGMKPFYGAPTLIIVSALPNEKSIGVGYANAGCIIENMLLAATDMGLGSVYLMAFTFGLNSDKTLLSDLGIPQGFVPVSGLVVGYPSGSSTPDKELKQIISCNLVK